MDASRLRRHLGPALRAALLLAVCASAARADLAAGDRAWAARAEVLDGRLAHRERIDAAIGHYRAAVEADPDSLAARWRLLRALHYAAEFTNLPEAEKEERVVEAVELAQASSERASGGEASDGDRARLLFWSAIAWGARAQRVGLLTLVREGLATRMHDFAQRSLDLDPQVDGGGALRLLSRLHATLPRVPFISGWVDRDRALPLAERGLALEPGHPGNRLILALTLLELAPDRTPEARKLLGGVAAAEPRSDFVAEDLAIRERARERLAELRHESG